MARRDPILAERPDEGPPSWATPPWAAHGSRPPAGGADEDQEIWLLSYSDLVTLLFSVFVMLLAITTLKDQLPNRPPPAAPVATVAPPSAGAPDHLGEQAVHPVAVQPAPPPPVDDRARLEADEVAVEAPEPLTERWRRRLSELGMPAGVAVNVRQNRVAISIGDAILFAPGQVELSEEGRGVLARLAPALAATPGEIAVEGHTDAVPIASARFPSNWELSVARAASVVRALIEAGVAPARLSAVGYAETRPLVPERDAASRARNRRVTLTIQADG